MDLLFWTNVKISIKTSQGVVVVTQCQLYKLVGTCSRTNRRRACTHWWSRCRLPQLTGWWWWAGWGVWLWAAYRTQWCNRLCRCCCCRRRGSSLLGLYSLSLVLMSYRSACCSIIYFPLSSPPPHVFICSSSFSRLPFMLILALCLSSPLSPLPHVSVLLAHHGSALLTLTEGSRVAEGRGLSSPLSPSLSLCLSWSFCCSLNRFPSSKGRLQITLREQGLLATLQHSSLFSSSLLLLN